jgi:enoyl-CoA hydratase/carnithine racemase
MAERTAGADAVSETANAGEDLLYEVRGGVGYVTLNRPQARNAMTFAMYERLAEICAQVNDDRSMRALLLTGAGEKAFASGTDISQFRAFSTAEDALGYEARIDRVLDAIEKCRVPTVAAISGACTGGGLAIAVCCDLRVATATSRFGFPVARTLGNCLAMNNYARMAALVGPARVKDLIFTSRLMEGPEAHAIGLITEVLDDSAALKLRAEELIREVADRAPLTLQATKEALRRLRPQLAEGEGNDLVLMCYLSEDFREGMDAFLNKRKPVWRGK